MLAKAHPRLIIYRHHKLARNIALRVYKFVHSANTLTIFGACQTDERLLRAEISTGEDHSAGTGLMELVHHLQRVLLT